MVLGSLQLNLKNLELSVWICGTTWLSSIIQGGCFKHSRSDAFHCNGADDNSIYHCMLSSGVTGSLLYNWLVLKFVVLRSRSELAIFYTVNEKLAFLIIPQSVTPWRADNGDRVPQTTRSIMDRTFEPLEESMLTTNSEVLFSETP